jgi:AcrR family transcriptional regulator
VTKASPPPTARRQRSRRGEGGQLRNEILAATERLLIETGDEDAVSIRAVAEAIGVTPPAIYRHFTDKAHLLFEVCDQHFERMDRFVAEAVAGQDDPVEVLRALAYAYVRFGRENPEHYRIMFMGRPQLTPQQYADVLTIPTGSFAQLVDCVQACMDAGRVRPQPADAFALSLSLWAVVHGVTSLLIAKPYLPARTPDDLVDSVIDISLNGMLQ